MDLTLNQKISLCYNSAVDKKANDVVVLDVRGISEVADIFIIGGGSSGRHVRTIADSIEKALRQAGEKEYHIEGYENALWILLDAGDVVIHIFQNDTRRYYNLERLWDDAEKVSPGDLVLVEV